MLQVLIFVKRKMSMITKSYTRRRRTEDAQRDMAYCEPMPPDD
jgi:hypothetical protein